MQFNIRLDEHSHSYVKVHVNVAAIKFNESNIILCTSLQESTLKISETNREALAELLNLKLFYEFLISLASFGVSVCQSKSIHCNFLIAWIIISEIDAI